MEISIVLYFKNQLDEEIDFITTKDYRKLLGIEDINSPRESSESNNQDNRVNNNNNILENNINDILQSNYNNMANSSNNKNNAGGINNDKNIFKSQKSTIIELKSIKDKILQLIESFSYV